MNIRHVPCFAPGRQRLLARRAQRGVALTEMVVVCLALVPLFLLVPVVAKYQDLAYATQMASRYVAFDAIASNEGMSAWKPVDQLEAEVRRRFYSNSDAPIKTGDVAGEFSAHHNPFHTDQLGNSLIEKWGDVRVTFGPKLGPSHADAFTTADDNKPFTTLGAYDVSGEMGLKNGIYTANVSVKLADLPVPPGSFANTYETFKKIGITMTRHTSVVVDTWTASGPAQVESRIDTMKLNPGKFFQTGTPKPVDVVDAAVRAMESPDCFPSICPKGKGPRLGDLEFWRDTVPADRLK
jgi:hypothetical protein